MARKRINWKTKGMNRDLSVSAFNPEFAFENINLRLSTNEGNTMMSWVNEKGPSSLTVGVDTNGFRNPESGLDVAIIGAVIGTAVLNHKLILFTVDNKYNYDYIYMLWKSDDTESEETYDLMGKILYKGHLNFNIVHPIETIVSYESESIQKVYWTDGINQPRVINIASEKSADTLKDFSFDFVPELQLKEEVKIKKIFGSGEFPAGVIQYAFTYYNKYGQESNIFHTTPLQYISYIDRGGSPGSRIANSFRIDISGVDQNFEYLRIYSILRTSRDAVPMVRRVQDIEITSSNATYIDDGLHGDTIDPTELLYKGGENIKVETLEQKDGTLFLGNLKTERPSIVDIADWIKETNRIDEKNPEAKGKIESVLTERDFTIVSKEPFSYINTLSCVKESNDTDNANYEGAAGFKAREWYRLGVQFQYKNGKWSEPCWIGDKQQTCSPADATTKEGKIGKIKIPEFKYTLDKGYRDNNIFKDLYDKGYRKVRPVFAVPKFSDRTILCQGVGCPTMYRKADRYAKTVDSEGNEKSGENPGILYAQSSWLFRAYTTFPERMGSTASGGGGYVCARGKLKSQYEDSFIQLASDGYGNRKVIASPYLRSTEIMGVYDDDHSFNIDANLATIHTPEVIFDESLASVDFADCVLNHVGNVYLSRTYGDISIQTTTPAIGSDAAGFVHRSIVTEASAALITAPFYNDYLVDEMVEKDGSISKYEAYNTKSPAVDFPVYMWHKNGSLNNDINRANRSAELLKKKISNYRLSNETTYLSESESYTVEDIQLFNSDELSVVKIGGNIYMGNIETMLVPTEPSPYYFIGNPFRKSNSGGDKTDFMSASYYKLALADVDDESSRSGVWSLKEKDGVWNWQKPTGDYRDIGDGMKGLCQWREPVSMKYKSTPHIVAKLGKGNNIFYGEETQNVLPMVEVTKPYKRETFFGGASKDALQACIWVPCGPAVAFESTDEQKDIYFKWGDTYYQRFECLKTYPFTTEDKNQVIEIASFMCESRINMDGRYDRNRGQTSNLNMSPQNFNLLNPVYSQMDNFFSYRITDEDNYRDTIYPNNITWTKTKENGADIDLWTNITMANTLELDGDKGEITKLVKLNNQLLVFQDKGISQVLYNENTQISTTEGVPIEIANSQKVQGKRYYTNTVGCSNKWSIVQTPAGIYFMDSNDKSIYLFNGQLSNLSVAGGFNAWSKQNIPSAEVKWNPKDFGNFVACYDKKNQDVLFVNKDTALAYSEKFGCFTSFYDYGGAPYLCELDDMLIWTNPVIKESYTYTGLLEHQAGEYGNFFGKYKPFSMTLIANQEPQTDKIFTNVEFRACVEGEGIYNKLKDTLTPSLPFDSLEAWNEYQHGITALRNRRAGERMQHGKEDSVLARKFRIWSCDVPRDNAPIDPKTEAKMGIKRFKKRPLDRIRNTWAYIKLKKEASETMSKTEIHDIVLSYFN